MRARRVLTVRLVIEAEKDNMDPTESFTEERLLFGVRKVNNANIGMAVFNHRDVRVSRHLFEKLGSASPEMERLMEIEFGPDEDDPEPKVAAAG